MIEQEVKLRFDSYEAAHQAVTTAGGRLVQSRRTQDDLFLDTPTDALDAVQSALRLRREPNCATLTFKGPPQAGPVKSREEIETTCADADAAETILRRLGLVEFGRLSKQREDWLVGDTRVFIDTTPVGVFVEIEGTIDTIALVAASMGRTADDYILLSYRRLYSQQ